MLDPMTRSGGFSASRGVTAAVIAILALALWVRLDGIGERTMSHIESYAPGIPYPAGISDPPPRLDQKSNLLWAANDVHGPTWYLWMLPYVQAGGYEIAMLRWPAVLLGFGAVAGLFRLSRRVGGSGAGLAAAALMAASGHHVFWSQRARFYAMAIFLAVWSTVFLLELLGEKKRGRTRLAAYAAATLGGLTTLYYYWPLFGVQCVWTAIAESRRGPRVTLWLVILAIAATPVLTLAVYQARPAPYLGYADGEVLRGYLAFGFLFDPAIDTGAAERGRISGQWAGLLAVGALLALAALGGRRPWASEPADLPPPPLWLAASTAGLATAVILAGIGPAAAAFPHKTTLLWATATFPAIGLAGFWALSRWTKALAALPAWLGSPTAALWLLAFGPVALAAAVHQYTPFYAPRGMALFSPFSLALLGLGLAAAARRGRVGAAAACVASALLVPWHFQSVAIAQHEPGAFQYRQLAEQVQRRLEPGDAIVFSPHWSVTPLLYYWLDESDRLIGADWPSAVAERRRVWLIESVGRSPAPELTDFLGNWTPLDHESARGLRATLYRR